MLMPLLYVAFLVIATYYLFYRRDNIQLPGPRPWPVIGNVYQLSQDPWYYMHKWGKTFNGLFKFYRFRSPVVVACSYQAIHEILVTRGKAFGGKDAEVRQLFIIGSGSYFQPGQWWELFRRASVKHFKLYSTQQKTDENSGMRILEDLMHSFASHDGQPFFPRSDVSKYVVESSVVALIGRKDTVSDELFGHLVEVTNLGIDLMETFGSLPDMHKYRLLLLFNGRVRRAGMALRQKCKLLFTRMDTEFAEGEQQEPSLINALYNLHIEGLMEKQSLQYGIVNLIIGSSVSTLPPFLTFINCFAYYKSFARKLQEEVDRVIGARAPSVLDKPKMPYTRATIFELLRLLVRYIPHHFAVENTYIGDVAIPRGIEVAINVRSLFYDESFWSDPFEFRPERFLDSVGNMLPSDHEARKRILPFGAGPRVCVGQALAMDRFLLMITSLVQRFEVKLLEPKLYCNPKDQPRAAVYFAPDFKVIMVPRHGRDD